MNLHKISRLFKASSDRTRLRILNLLAQEKLCVCEIMRTLDLPQTKISRHLAYLRKANLVKTRRKGQMVFYSLIKPKDNIHAALIQCLKHCFKDGLLQKDLKRIKGVNK